MEDSVRTMDDRGYVPIPVNIQKQIGVRAVELPQFSIKVEDEPKKHIALYPLTPSTDKSSYISHPKESSTDKGEEL